MPKLQAGPGGMSESTWAERQVFLLLSFLSLSFFLFLFLLLFFFSSI